MSRIVFLCLILPLELLFLTPWSILRAQAKPSVAKVTTPNATSSASLRIQAEKELSLIPWQNRMKNKAEQTPPFQVDHLPKPKSVIPPAYTEVALTLSTLAPQGSSQFAESQKYDLEQVESLPVVSAQIQRWLSKDFEKGQNLGFLIGTSVGEKNIQVQLPNGYSASNVSILYMKLLAGLSLEKVLWEDRLHLGLNGLFVEELWQQNAPTIESRWSRWVPSMAASIQLKGLLNQSWYSLLEVHNQWPLRDNDVETSNQRLHLGLGYYL